MGTTAQKLQKILDTKLALKTSINAKGGTITDTTPFSEYPTQVDNISSTPSFTDPNFSFIYSISSYDMFVNIDTYDSDIKTNTIYIYKQTITYTYSTSTSITNVNERKADIYLFIGFGEIESIMKVCGIPLKNPNSDGSIALSPVAAEKSLSSSYIGRLQIFNASDDRGYAKSVTLNNSELLYVIDSNE